MQLRIARACILFICCRSFRNWRNLSREGEVLHSHVVERREFMTLSGIAISITLGMGILWLAL